MDRNVSLTSTMMEDKEIVLGVQNKMKKINDGFSLGLLGIAILLAIVIMVKLISLGANPVAAADGTEPDKAACSSKGQEKLTPSQEMAEALKKKNMFLPPSPKPQPPSEVKGIFGARALINGKWYEVGDTVPPGAKIIAIEAAHIKIEWEGKELTLAPIKATTSSGPPAPPKKSVEIKDKAAGPSAPKHEVVGSEAPAEPPATDDLAWLDIPEKFKEKFRETWNKMTPEQKEKAKEHWNNMSDEQKQQAIEAWSRHP